MGEKRVVDIQCFFVLFFFLKGISLQLGYIECSELFALAPIAFILLFPCHCTHIWFVLSVWILEFIHNNYCFWWASSPRRKRESRGFHTSVTLLQAFKFNCRCLQFFWTHPKTMQCFVVDTKSTFFRSLFSAPSIQK